MQTIDHLIINSPYEEPAHYWSYDRGIPVTPLQMEISIIKYGVPRINTFSLLGKAKNFKKSLTIENSLWYNLFQICSPNTTQVS